MCKAAAGPSTLERDSDGTRPFHASVLLDAGEGRIKAVAEWLGHADPGFALRTYGHLMPDMEDRTRRAKHAAWTADGLQTASDHGCRRVDGRQFARGLSTDH